MNIYDELSEIEELKERSIKQKNDILDYYSNNPEQAKKLLLEVIEIDKELIELEEQFKTLQNEIY